MVATPRHEHIEDHATFEPAANIQQAATSKCESPCSDLR
jgi:hypothetical protein